MPLRTNMVTLRLRRVLIAGLLVAAVVPAVRWARRRRPEPARAPAPAAYWVVDDSVALRGDASPQADSAVWDGRTVRLAGMRNEVVAWQLAARPAAFVEAATAAVAPLKDGRGNRLPAAGHLALFQAWLLPVAQPSQVADGQPLAGSLGPGDYPCQLIPLPRDRPFQLPAGEVSSLWFDYWIPPTAVPGLYRGSLVLRLGAEGEIRFDLELRVHALTMPAEIHYRNWFRLDPHQLVGYFEETGPFAEALVTRAARLAAEHRANALPALRLEPPEQTFDQWFPTQAGLLRTSLEDAGPHGTAPPPVVPLELPLALAPLEAETVARELVRGLRREGLLDRAVVLAEQFPEEPLSAAEVRYQGRRLRQMAGDSLPLLADIALDLDSDPSLLEEVGIVCANDLTPEERAVLTRLGRRWWVRDGGLGVEPLLDQPLLGIVAWGAEAWRRKIDGHWIWNIAYWRQSEQGVDLPTDLYHDPLTVNDAAPFESDESSYRAGWARRLNGDGVWIYPGPRRRAKVLTPSLRLKAFRRAAQDYEYLWLLRQAGRGQAADAFAERLSPAPGQWEADAKVWQATRQEMAELLLKGKRP